MKKEEFFTFLDKKKEETMEESRRLEKEERKDESNTLKAKANIYDIFKTVWNAVEGMTQSEEELERLFVTKIQAISTPWEKSLEAAKKHDDVEKIVIEEAKLSAVREIKEQLGLEESV